MFTAIWNETYGKGLFRSERVNLLLTLHGQLNLISNRGSFTCIIPQTGEYIPQPLLHQLRTLAGMRNTLWVHAWGIYLTTYHTMGREREREMFYLTTHSTHFIYGYMASDIWLRTILIVRNETRCRHIGYSYRLAARVLLYAPSHRQDNTYHGLCYTSRGALAGTRNSSMDHGQMLYNGATYHSFAFIRVG